MTDPKMPEDELTAKVLEILANNRGCPVKSLHASSRLLDDLGLAGDDVDDLFRDLMNEFGEIDLNEFDFYRYFIDEAAGLWPWSRSKGNRRPKFPVTVAHLVDVVRAKKWFDPEEAV